MPKGKAPPPERQKTFTVRSDLSEAEYNDVCDLRKDYLTRDNVDLSEAEVVRTALRHLFKHRDVKRTTPPKPNTPSQKRRV